MPDAPASPNRSSLLGWVKNLKRLALALSDSINTISDTETERLPVNPRPSESHELLRPILNHKSRSTNNVHRLRLDSAGPSSMSADLLCLRQHRDLFLQNHSLVEGNSQYFGVPLQVAISQALVKISIMAQDLPAPGMPHYGRIPIVVAKCGVFLKKNGLAVEGIFRVGGLSKRIRELQAVFNAPPDFGRKLDWDGYNVHDAASVLRRYLNALPEPLIPLELYEEFRDPLRLRLRIIKFMKYRAENPRKAKQKKTHEKSEAGNANTEIEAPQPDAVPLDGLNPDKSEASLNEADSHKNEVDPHKSEADPHQIEAEALRSKVNALQIEGENLTEGKLLAEEDAVSRIASEAEGDQEVTAAAEELQKQPQHAVNANLVNVELKDPEHSQDVAAPAIPAITVDLHCKKPADASKPTLSPTKTYRKLATDVYAAIDDYKHLLDELPGLSRQLLFYILDLLSMVQNNSDENLMSARNLAAIFQPSILLHPSHDMDPDEYALSQLVVEFLIQYAYKLLPSDQVLPRKTPPQALADPGRTHSKSLSNANPDYLDMIGYHTMGKNTRNLAVSDTEHDFGSASSDDELVSQLSYLLPKHAPAPNLMSVIHSDSLS